MLVLSRKPGERVIIGDRVIEIEVLEIRGSQVKLGILAPLDVHVNREEVFLRLMEEREAAKLHPELHQRRYRSESSRAHPLKG